MTRSESHIRIARTHCVLKLNILRRRFTNRQWTDHSFVSNFRISKFDRTHTHLREQRIIILLSVTTTLRTIEQKRIYKNEQIKICICTNVCQQWFLCFFHVVFCFTHEFWIDFYARRLFEREMQKWKQNSSPTIRARERRRKRVFVLNCSRHFACVEVWNEIWETKIEKQRETRTIFIVCADDCGCTRTDTMIIWPPSHEHLTYNWEMDRGTDVTNRRTVADVSQTRVFSFARRISWDIGYWTLRTLVRLCIVAANSEHRFSIFISFVFFISLFLSLLFIIKFMLCGKFTKESNVEKKKHTRREK